ncbi:MAG: hypothetical protein DRJ42_00130 [Deltaproteobacteria bacterium]|nr:MAG: hypothetical protein DRJ42_00130 [Deltaproteobacteria bacterium]
MEANKVMRLFLLALLAAGFLSAPGTALAADPESHGPATDRYVLSLRADFSQIHSEFEDFFAIGGSLGLHIPFGSLPIGVEVMASLAGDDSHLIATNDLSLRYYLPASGGGPDRSLQPFVKAGPTLSVALWDGQDTGVTVGGVVGLGLHAWFSDLFGLTFEFTYRIKGGDELRQTMILSVGMALGP